MLGKPRSWIKLQLNSQTLDQINEIFLNVGDTNYGAIMKSGKFPQKPTGTLSLSGESHKLDGTSEAE
ncbi:hypothetical protein TcWFU_008291 [Taenia crassiceps]|uniref:Uncharacterized protein n=1 Tax=Taenia crassiceps TaxID=6207 RepID=A0ABR4QSL0_9CEST